MRLTKKSKYAARAMVEIALSGRGSPLGVAEIARRGSIPERFLEQIFRGCGVAAFLRAAAGRTVGTAWRYRARK